MARQPISILGFLYKFVKILIIKIDCITKSKIGENLKHLLGTNVYGAKFVTFRLKKNIT